MNKKDLEQMSEAARILACRCFCDVRIEGQRMAGIPSWYIICVPRTIRKSMLPVLWPDVVKQAGNRAAMAHADAHTVRRLGMHRPEHVVR